jgi:diguanylate cyclase (GGDEF)-like protein
MGFEIICVHWKKLVRTPPMTRPIVRNLLLALLLLASAGAAAQQLALQHFGQKEGLGNLSVNALAQDRQGYLWAATENGLFRFNGAEFRRYAAAEGFQEQLVTAVHSSRAGLLLAGTYNSLYRLHEGRMQPVTAGGKALPVWPGQVMEETAAGEVLVISVARLFAVTGDGKQARPYFSAAQLEQLPGLASVRAVYADTDGSLWLSCKDALCHAGKDRIDVLGAAQGLPAAGPWTSIVRDSGGTLWLRSAKRVFALPPQAQRFEERTPPGDLFRKTHVRTELHADNEGRVLTNADPGLLRWDDGRWQALGQRNGLNAAGGVADILADSGHGMWLATRGRGMVHWLGYGNWENWTTVQGLPDDVIISMLRGRDGRLHIGTRSGHALQATDGSRFDVAPTPPELAGHQWASMAQDRQGRIWAGTYSGLVLRYLPDSGKTELIGKLPQVTEVLPDGKGQVWVASSDGLYVVAESAPAGTGLGRAQLPASPGRDAGTPVLNGCQDLQGHLWFVSAGDVLHYDGTDWQILPFGRHTGNVEFDTVACASEGGALWAGGEGKLWRLQVHGAPAARRVEAAVLAERAVQMLYVDSRGWLWVGTDGGFAVWNGNRWRMANQSLGLAWDDINGRGFYEDRDGSMWIATSNGLSHLAWPNRLFDAAAPHAVLEQTLRGGGPVRLDGGPLPWSPDPLVFRLASLAYEDRQGLQYRYRLAGSEQQWSVTAAPEVRYAGLPGGDYRFEYQAINGASGDQSPLGQAAFTILPPWWRSLPFYGLCAGIVLLGFYGIHRYRLRAMTLRQIELAIVVQQRTRELEQSQEELRMRALKDGLTKAWNRSAMMELLEREIEKCRRTGESFVLVLLDLDFFKRINDTHGHLAGDAVLVEVARRLTVATRPYDAVGRYGGEEFMVLLPGLTLPDGAHRIEALRNEVRATPVDTGDGKLLPVTASFGAAAFNPRQPQAATELLRVADEALYASKHRGRDRISYADGARDAHDAVTST